MENTEFLKLSSEDKIKHLLALAFEDREELLEFLKNKKKVEWFSVSAKVKSSELSSQSNVVNEEHDKIAGVKSTFNVELEKLEDNPYQPRFPVPEHIIKELAMSIDTSGLLQPIVVNRSSENCYQIIAGHTRRDGLKYNNKTEGLVFLFSEISKDNPDYKKVMLTNAVVENLHRNDLDPLETALSFKLALDEKIYKNQAELVQNISLNKDQVSKIMSVLKLHESIIQDLRINKSVKDVYVLYFIQRIKDIKIQQEIYNKVSKGEMNREDVQNFLKEHENKSVKPIKEKNSFKMDKKKIVIENNFSSLDKTKQEELQVEIQAVIKKYIS